MTLRLGVIHAIEESCHVSLPQSGQVAQNPRVMHHNKTGAWLNLFDHLVGDKRRQDRKQSTERYRHNVIGAGRPAAHYAFLDRSLGELRDA